VFALTDYSKTGLLQRSNCFKVVEPRIFGMVKLSGHFYFAYFSALNQIFDGGQTPA
jgi:hypothetical protein